MPRVLLRETLTQKHMPQMRPTIGTSNLRANPIRIHTPLHRARNLIIKTRPPTISLKLTLRTVKRRAAAFAHVRALIPKRIILTSKRHLRPLIHNNPLLLPGQRLKLSFFIRQNNHQTNKPHTRKKTFAPEPAPSAPLSNRKHIITTIKPESAPTSKKSSSHPHGPTSTSYPT
jgi:hypothetical protein